MSARAGPRPPGQARPQPDAVPAAPAHFNPTGPRYTLCCCHVKTFTVGFGIVEIFFICFLLVAVLPDLSSKLCGNAREEREVQSLLDSDFNDTEPVEQALNDSAALWVGPGGAGGSGRWTRCAGCPATSTPSGSSGPSRRWWP